MFYNFSFLETRFDDLRFLSVIYCVAVSGISRSIRIRKNAVRFDVLCTEPNGYIEIKTEPESKPDLPPKKNRNFSLSPPHLSLNVWAYKLYIYIYVV